MENETKNTTAATTKKSTAGTKKTTSTAKKTSGTSTTKKTTTAKKSASATTKKATSTTTKKTTSTTAKKPATTKKTTGSTTKKTTTAKKSTATKATKPVAEELLQAPVETVEIVETPVLTEVAEVAETAETAKKPSASPARKLFSLQQHLPEFLPATDEEKAYLVKMRPASTFFRDGVKRLLKNKVATISFFFIVFITIACIVIPFFWPYGYEQNLGAAIGKPVDSSYANLAPFTYGATEEARREAGEFVFPHIFGTDSAGRDYFIRIVYGARISLAVGFFASLIVLIIGITIGSIAGYFGGWVDMIIMRFVDVIYSLPDMLMVILLASVLKDVIGESLDRTFLAKIGSNIISLFIVFGVLYWVSMARLIRGQILSLREQEYVLAARATGAKGSWIIKKHLLPNCISVVIISTALQIPSAIFTESYLSFLGLGVNAPMPSLGSLASEALNGYTSYPYRLVIPAIVISLIVLSLNLFGDGLRDAFDPKLND